VLLTACSGDSLLMLDALDLLLNLGVGYPSKLKATLEIGGSVWTVSDDPKSLERRVSSEEALIKAQATAPQDLASTELSTAWSCAFGLHPNPSDAWDHAIKAVEALLIPAVVPRQDKPTLGHVVGALRSQLATNPGKWTLDLDATPGQTDGQTLLGLLDILWANPDRHANTNARIPDQAEAEAVVKVAVLILGLCRSGRLRKIP